MRAENLVRVGTGSSHENNVCSGALATAMNETLISGLGIVALMLGVLALWIRDDHRDRPYHKDAQERAARREKEWYSKLD
jgi:hypothetical protein